MTRQEFRRRVPLVKRLGETATRMMLAPSSGVWGYISGIPKDNPEAMKKAAVEYSKTGAGNYAAYLAVGKSRLQETNDKHREAARAKAVADFREAHPNIALSETDRHKKWEEQEATRKYSNTFSRIVRKSDYAIEYFSKGSAYSFAKSIPRRSTGTHEGFDGSYQELAKSTLGDALKHQKEDGTIPLLGIEAEKMRFAAHEHAGDSLREITRAETSYVEGASTALWQLGFVEFDNEHDVKYGKGQFNPSIEWGQTENQQGTTASIAFNPNNELHQMLVTDASTFTNPRIEVDVFNGSDPRSAGRMDLRVVEAAEPTVAIAA